MKREEVKAKYFKKKRLEKLKKSLFTIKNEIEPTEDTNQALVHLSMQIERKIAECGISKSQFNKALKAEGVAKKKKRRKPSKFLKSKESPETKERKAKAKKLYSLVEKKHKHEKKKKIANSHKATKYGQKRVILVQGGAPGLGKNK